MQAATNIPAIIGVAGPSLCLVLVMVAWVAYRRARGSSAELPMPARHALSLAGVVGVAAIHFRVGRELTRWVPPTTGSVAGMLGIIVIPVIAGMGIVILANIPAANAIARIAEASFWIFAAIGAFMAGAAQARPLRGTDHLRFADVGALLVAIVIVRMLVRGIPFVP